MTKLGRKRFLKLISATSMAIFSLFVCFSGAFAWFQAQREVGNESNDFYVESQDTAVKKITIHPFLDETTGAGESTPSYTFDPTGIVAFEEGNPTANPTLAELNQYSIDNPHHPVLILYHVDGFRTRIDLSTEYCFLNENTDFITGKTRTKSALNSLEGKVTNGYYEVYRDESQSNKTYLYQWNGSSLNGRTVATYNDLDVAANKVDGLYTRVQSDSNYSGVASVYCYDNTAKKFNLVWIDLGDDDKGQTNPLSSVVDFFTITYDKNDYANLAALSSNHTVNLETYNSTTQELEYEVSDGTIPCISVAKTQMTDSNKTNFAKLSDADTYNRFYNDICVYDDESNDMNFVGVVVDYNQLALEYISSHNLGHDAINNGLVFVCDWITKF